MQNFEILHYPTRIPVSWLGGKMSYSDTAFNDYRPFWKKGAYCFAPVGRSVDQAMSAQYLLTPLLACREKMTPIDFQITWSKVKVKLLVYV